MIVLSRENIIEGLIELRAQEENQNNTIVNNIMNITLRDDIDNIEKLRLINIEISSVILN